MEHLRCYIGAFIVKRASQPKVQFFSKDYVFSILKHGLHVLDRVHYRMLVPTSNIQFTHVCMNLKKKCN